MVVVKGIVERESEVPIVDSNIIRCVAASFPIAPGCFVEPALGLKGNAEHVFGFGKVRIDR